jgi:hypothetical protein
LEPELEPELESELEPEVESAEPAIPVIYDETAARIGTRIGVEAFDISDVG